MKISGSPAGFSALTSAPVSGEMRSVTMPSGIARRCSVTPLSASPMKLIQIGSAVCAPSSASPSGRSWSNPTHTVATRFDVKPLNQVSLASLVVPVLPAMSPRLCERARLPVPRLMTSAIMSSMTKAFCAVMTRGATSAAGSGAGSPCATSAVRTGCAPCSPGTPGAAACSHCGHTRLGAARHTTCPGILDALDEVGLDAIAAVGEHRVGGRKIERRHRHGTQGERQVMRHGLRIEAEALHVVDRGRDADLLEDADRDQVA